MGLREALMKRKGAPSPSADEMNPKSDLAPPSSANPPEAIDSPAGDAAGPGQEEALMGIMDALKSDPAMLAKVQAFIEADSQESSMDDSMQGFDQEVTGGMSDHEKQDISGRSPRSLGERAKQAALGRVKVTDSK